MIDTFYTVELTVSNCTAEVWLNDVPVYRRGQEFGVFAGGPFNELVRDGRNELTLVVEPSPRPRSALLGEGGARARRPPGQGATAEAILGRYPRGASVGGPDREVLARAAWEARADGQPTFFPRVEGATAELGAVFGPWAWEGAERLTLDEALEDEVEGLLDELHGLIEVFDWAGLATRTALRSGEITRAYALPPGEKASELFRVLESESSKPGWRLSPVDRSRFDLRLCGGGRMVECAGRDGEPLLRCEADEKGDYVSFPTFVSRIGGALTVVR